MKRTTATLIATAFAGFGAVSFAQSLATSDAFGPTMDTVALEDTRIDAEMLFNKIDVDRNNIISIDEYAAQAVVRASLARFNQAVVIDGGATFNIKVPAEATRQMAAFEQTAIDAVARAEYFNLAGEDGEMDRSEWVQSRLAEFAAADHNEDGRLKGAELEVYAMNVARYRVSMS